MKTIKNFTTEGVDISVSFTMSNVNGLLPLKTEVWLNRYYGGKFIDKKVAFSTDNTGNITLITVANSKSGILTFNTILSYEKEDSMPDMISALNLSYKLVKDGRVEEFTKSDSMSNAKDLKIVKITKIIELS